MLLSLEVEQKGFQVPSFVIRLSTFVAHLRHSRQSFTQAQLQSSFYVLYTAEMETILSGFRAFPGLQKSHLKKFPHAAKVYLLDTLELNSKSRCIFAWAGLSLSIWIYHSASFEYL
jgi:hypothetical protein